MRRALAALLALGALGAPAAAAPKWYLAVDSVEGKEPITVDEAKKVFLEEVARRGDDFAVERADGLQGVWVTIRVARVSRAVRPAREPGKRDELERGVRLSLVGVTIPERRMLFGGSGDASVAVPLREGLTAADEQALVHDALRAAIDHALEGAVEELRRAATAPPPAATRKKPAKGPAGKPRKR